MISDQFNGTMARPRLSLGGHGKVARIQIGKNAWVAKARVRDLDGVTRLIERRSPVGTIDKFGAQAEAALIHAVTGRTAPSAGDLTGESPLSAVWRVYRAQLVADGKAPRTLDRYDYVGAKIITGLGSIHVREATTQRLDTFVRMLAIKSGPSVARTARVLLSGMFKLAARYGACASNPVRDVSSVRITKKASRALTVDDVAAILRGMAMSTKELPPLEHAKRQSSRTTIANYCDEADLVDVVTVFAATGCRISEVLGLRWSDVNLDTKTVSITGKVIGVKGRGLVRDNCTKTEAGRRVLPLPSFAVSMLLARQVSAQTNTHNVVFPSAVGTLRDPDGVSKQWRRVRDALGYEWVTSHTFRRTLATIIDAEGMTARIGADQLGHRHVSMTQDVYMGRGEVHTEVAEALDRTIGRRSNFGQNVG